MCYPCRRCGQCGEDVSFKFVKCPKCNTEFQIEDARCPECGWTMPLPPGQAAPQK